MRLTANNDTNSNGKWINVVVSKKVHDDLKILGDATQSFNEIIENLLAEKAPIIKAIKEAREKKPLIQAIRTAKSAKSSE